ncbi:unnamed protein product [Blepharisma stoltei]|uniref:Adenylate kinase isoenzyme 6 homolog n=1 Tax=Blepharisma stoltei TaxID=1481888 RepID=A0AAU9K2F1_9CILI|nr:unnamed protein product [Blepharisma stoltei]
MEIRAPNILITGTPGTGKTTLARLLEDQLNETIDFPKFEVISLGALINEKHLYKNWNEQFQVPEFDEDLVCDAIEADIRRGGKIVDFHSCAFFPPDWFHYIVLLRASNTNIFDRLSERGYPEPKIQENVQCEIFQVCKDEVEDSYPKEKILERNSDTIVEMERNVEEIIELIKKTVEDNKHT